MWYYITYYIKKYWYILSLIVVVLFLGASVLMNNGELISYFEKFENKISFKPDKFVETEVDDLESYLKDLKVGAPYLGNSLTSYVPNSYKGGSEEEFFREMRKDPDFIYRKKISWAYGSITEDEFTELMELVGYHLNKNKNSTTTIVSKPTIEQLEEYDQKVMYYTDDDGVLYLNLYVEEVNESSNTIKTYVYTYRLKYDMKGKVNIR